MSNHRIKLIAALCTIACSMGLGTAQANKEHPKSHSHHSTAAATTETESGSQVRVANNQGSEKKFSDLQGKTLGASAGQQLGKIEDLVIDTQSGKVAYVAVAAIDSSRTGDKLKLVPQSSLQCDESSDQLTTQLDKAAFDTLASIDRSDLNAGRIPESAQSQTWNSRAASTSSTIPNSTPSSASSSAVAQNEPGAFATSAAASRMSNHLVCASKLSGKQVRTGNEDVGTVETVAVDLNQGTATAVVKTNSAFAGTDATFFVPFMNLQIDSAESPTITTTLERSDFTQAQSAQSSSTTTAGVASTSDSSLTPTGRTDEESSSTSSRASSSTTGDVTSTSPSSTSSSSPTSTNPSSWASPPSRVTSSSPATSTTSSTSTDDEQLSQTGRDTSSQKSLSSAAAAIRTAISNDPTLASEDISVREAGRKIMLHGKVRNEETKSRIEQIAKSAASGTEIENKLKVDEQK
jgi:sporulation protein YlmC with PRC-barrel domain